MIQRFVALMVLIVGYGVSVRGDVVVFTDLGTGGFFNTDTGQSDPISQYSAVAASFTPTANYVFDDAQVALTFFSGSPPTSSQLFPRDRPFRGQPGSVIEQSP